MFVRSFVDIYNKIYNKIYDKILFIIEIKSSYRSYNQNPYNQNLSAAYFIFKKTGRFSYIELLPENLYESNKSKKNLDRSRFFLYVRIR